MKRIISVFLTLCMAAGFAAAGTMPASAADSVKIVLQDIAHYNESHGGKGKLNAVKTGLNEVTITGKVSNTPNQWLSLHLEENIHVIWNANLSGGGFFGLYRTGKCNRKSTFEIAGGNMPRLFIEQLEHSSIDVVISGGNFKDIYIMCHNLAIIGGTLKGSTENEPVIWARGNLSIGSNAVLDLIHEGGIDKPSCPISARTIYIAPGAAMKLNPPLTDYIQSNADFKQLTVIGKPFVTHDDFYLNKWQALHIPKGSVLSLPAGKSLTLSNHAKLVIDPGGTLVANGSLIKAELGKVTIKQGGMVKGKNAGQFTAWWQRFPAFLQWFMRWFFFGFLWMK